MCSKSFHIIFFKVCHPKIFLTLSMVRRLLSSADKLCKQFGPRSRPTEPGSKLFDILIVLAKELFEKVNFELILKKISRCQQRHEKLHSMQRVNIQKKFCNFIHPLISGKVLCYILFSF